MVPRVRYAKFFFRCISSAGVESSAVGAFAVTDVRSNVGLPQVGQNFFVESLHILRIATVGYDHSLLSQGVTYLKQA